MKKILAIAFAAVMLFAFAACGQTGGVTSPGVAVDLADGSYTAQIGRATADRIAHGWADRLSITVANGTITEVVFDSFDVDGNAKSANEDYPMEPKPADWMPELAEQVKNAATPEEIKGVAGASNSSANIVELYREILRVGVAGENITLELEVMYTAQIDRASAEALAYGWQDTLFVTYLGDDILNVIFESYDVEGNAKSENADYAMDPKPSDWMPELAEQVKNAKSADDIAGVTGASSSSENIKLLFAAIQNEGVANGIVEVSLLDADVSSDPAADVSSAA